MRSPATLPDAGEPGKTMRERDGALLGGAWEPSTVHHCQRLRPDEVEAPACIDFCARMAQAGRPVLVGALTIAEATRHQGKPLPRVQGIVVVAFDELAATELGVRMPSSELKKWRQG